MKESAISRFAACRPSKASRERRKPAEPIKSWLTRRPSRRRSSGEPPTGKILRALAKRCSTDKKAGSGDVWRMIEILTSWLNALRPGSFGVDAILMKTADMDARVVADFALSLGTQIKALQDRSPVLANLTAQDIVTGSAPRAPGGPGSG